MNLITHKQNEQIVVEVVSDSIIINKEEDALLLFEELFPLEANKVILHMENITPEFFDLRTRLAGAVLQKFVTYQIQLAIIGDFSAVTSKSLQAFINESNRGSQIFFLESVETAIKRLIRN